MDNSIDEIILAARFSTGIIYQHHSVQKLCRVSLSYDTSFKSFGKYSDCSYEKKSGSRKITDYILTDRFYSTKLNFSLYVVMYYNKNGELSPDQWMVLPVTFDSTWLDFILLIHLSHFKKHNPLIQISDISCIILAKGVCTVLKTSCFTLVFLPTQRMWWGNACCSAEWCPWVPHLSWRTDRHLCVRWSLVYWFMYFSISEPIINSSV